jgi:hypothetical protein
MQTADIKDSKLFVWLRQVWGEMVINLVKEACGTD